MKYISKNLTVLFYLSILLSGLVPVPLYAETFIQNGYFTEDVVWSKSGSPYLLGSDVFVAEGHHLSIGAGVEIRTGSSSPEQVGIFSSGGISILGTKEEAVQIDNVYGISLSGGTSIIQYLNFSNFSRAIHANSGSLVVATSTFKGGGIGIGLRNASSSIQNSQFESVNEAVHVFSGGGIFQVKGHSLYFGTGGEGNLLEESIPQASTLLRNNSFSVAQGVVWGVKNDSQEIVDAKSNWWGSKDGPGAPGASSAGSRVDVSPWLDKSPTELVSCCSSVMFIPGIEASRLQVDTKTIVGTSSNRLWEPNRNDDVRKLYLDSNGKSVVSNIYTAGIIDSAFGRKIYKNFIAAMDDMVTSGALQSWRSYPYDWRKPIDEVAEEHLIQSMVDLASSSPTKKATIVAHSNGGLIAKLLIKKLQEKGLTDLVEKVILVAVPELGTPQAIGSLLHGDGQRLLGGLILQAKVAQKLAINMPSAYSLLPSAKFFREIVRPVIYLGTSTISSEPDFEKFIQKASGNMKQFGKATSIHGLIDLWQFPAALKTVSIAESGIPTTEAIAYKENNPTSPYKNISTNSGDGTVLLSSATRSGQKKYVFDGGLIGVGHADILQAASVIAALKNEINPTIQRDNFEKYLLDDPYKYHHTAHRTIGVHSPIELHAYDTNGGHTGKIPNPDPASDLELYENNAQGVRFEIMNGDEYLVFSAPTTSATILLKGTGVGTFVIDDEIAHGTTSHTVTFTDLPVTPLLIGKYELGTSSTEVTGGILRLDVDGNGVDDVVATSTTVFDPMIHLASLRQVILSLTLSINLENKLIKKIDKVSTAIASGKIKQARKVLAAFDAPIAKRHILRKKLTIKDRNEIAEVIEAILTSLESQN